MTFFAGTMKFNSNGDLDLENGISPRWNFDNLWTAAVVVFEIMI